MESLLNSVPQKVEYQDAESQIVASCESEMKKRCIPLRPHHGMCLAYFEGKGYSEGFIAHMQNVLELLTGKRSETENLPEAENPPREMRNSCDVCRQSEFQADAYEDVWTRNSRDVCRQSGPRDAVNEEAVSDGEKGYVRLVVHTDEICRACPNNESGVCREAARVLGFDQGVLELCGLKDGQTLEFREFARLVQEKILSAGKRGEICGSCQWETICANRESRWGDCGIL
ncbi:MAG: DUF1284 domain-containing protein [Lachnospiraceae bacterium]|nr:DUF1284 domain-containing protein [Lachnospiraceae bacterium]